MDSSVIKNKYRILISADSRYILNTHKILTIQNLVIQRSVYIYAASQGFQE